MADSLDAYSPGEIDPIAFATLSTEEQTAVSGAIDSAAGVYTDRGQSGDGSQFVYRNDVTNQYFVSHDESVYLVQVIVDIGYFSLLGGLFVGVMGLLLVASGLWARRSGPSLRSDSLSETE